MSTREKMIHNLAGMLERKEITEREGKKKGEDTTVTRKVMRETTGTKKMSTREEMIHNQAGMVKRKEMREREGKKKGEDMTVTQKVMRDTTDRKMRKGEEKNEGKDTIHKKAWMLRRKEMTSREDKSSSCEDNDRYIYTRQNMKLQREKGRTR